MQGHPHDAALGNAHSFVSGGEAILAVALPLPQLCSLSVHEGATLPCVSCRDNNVIVAVAMAVAIAVAVAIVIFAIVVEVAVASAISPGKGGCAHWRVFALAWRHLYSNNLSK